MRLRTKERDFYAHYGEGGTRHVPPYDMCPYCYAEGCDPSRMSEKFREMVRERLRKHLCVGCGKPEGFCSCKSTMDADKAKTVRRNPPKRKLKAALSDVEARESAYQMWRKHENELMPVFGQEAFDAIDYALYRHDAPSEMSIDTVFRKLASAGIRIEEDVLDTISYGWTQRKETDYGRR